MADLPEPLKSRVIRRGWIPIEFINKGGGAKVYLCANTEVITSMQKLMHGQGAVSDSTTAMAEIGIVLKSLNDGLVRKKDALAALKVPLDPGNPTAFARLKREIEAMSATQHPSLIRLLGVDDKDPPEWFVMEWHPNGNLSNFISHYKGQIVKTIKAMLPMVEALAVVHEKGFVHRDIKPSNIFVSDQGHLVLGDLGIAFPTTEEGERLTEPSTTLVSRDWIPDWARFTDSSPQPKVDVFMLAKVIYFMVTGGQNVLATQLDDEFFDFCARHESLRLERSAQGDLIVMPPTGGETGRSNFRLNVHFGNWALADGTGEGFDSSTTFRLPNGANRSPDVSWIRRERWEALTPEQRRKFPPLCPDFVIELRSDSDRLNTLQEKMEEYLANGAQLGWLIDLLQRKVWVYRPNNAPVCLDNPTSVSGEPELPGYVLPLNQIWR